MYEDMNGTNYIDKSMLNVTQELPKPSFSFTDVGETGHVWIMEKNPN